MLNIIILNVDDIVEIPVNKHINVSKLKINGMPIIILRSFKLLLVK